MSRTSTGSSSRRDGSSDLPDVPARPDEIEEALGRLGVRPSRGLGQSFLTDPFVADALAALAVPAGEEPVFEVGGGLGIVTRALLRRGLRRLTVVERDPRLVRHLARTFEGRLVVVHADALRFPFPAEAVAVGSLPYAIATPLLLSRMRAGQARIAVLVQNEVAERFAAAPGSREYGRPTILARLFGDTELFQEVPAEAFHPRPKVAGRLLVYRSRRGPLPVPSVEGLERVVRLLFSSRRKQLGNLVSRLTGSAGDSFALAAAARWPPGWERLRPEELEPAAYFRLAALLGPTPTSGAKADRTSRTGTETPATDQHRDQGAVGPRTRA